MFFATSEYIYQLYANQSEKMCNSSIFVHNLSTKNNIYIHNMYQYVQDHFTVYSRYPQHGQTSSGHADEVHYMYLMNGQNRFANLIKTPTRISIMHGSKELYVTRYWYVNWAIVVHINILGPLTQERLQQFLNIMFHH